jgi:hypothetical protein
MISFVVITDTPVRLRDFLVSRGVIEQNSSGNYVGVRPGMEWVMVPNPIQTDPGPPPVYDDRAVFLVKFAHESEDFDVDGPKVDNSDPENPVQIPVWDWSKFGKWVKANSSVVDAPVNYTINGIHAGSARKVTGEQVWLAHIDPDRFGVWQ